MKRAITRMVAAVLAAILFLPFKSRAISARHAILLDAQTGRVLYSRSADTRSLIASTTKIMTALIICEQCNVLDRVRIPKEAVGIEGSSMYLQEGEVLTVQELLYGMMLHSGNDAAVALAIYCAGTVEGFAELMNDKARLLGMDQSHFENPNGLDSPQHYSTARDLAVLASYAMRNPIFAKTVSTKTVNIGRRSLRNHNKLLWRLDCADGVKTGYTKAAGRSLVSSAVKNGRRLVAVTLCAPDDWNDHIALIQKGFEDYSVRKIVSAGDVLGQTAVIGGEIDRVDLIAQEDFAFSLAPGEQPEIVLPGNGFVYAPIACGQSAGVGYIVLGSSVVGSVPLAFSDSVEIDEEPEKDKAFWEKWLGREYS